MLRYRKEKEEIVSRFLRLYEAGMINMFEGNISMRMDDCVLITPSQMEKDQITAEDVVELEMEGNRLNDNGRSPSSEYRMHLAVYRLRDDLKAVVHTHSPYATAYAVAGIPIRVSMAETYMFFGGEIPVCSYGAPGTDDISADFRKYFIDEDKDSVLVGNHGAVSSARTLQEAFSKTEAIEKLAMIDSEVKKLGSERRFTEEEKETLLKFYRERKDR